MYTSQVKFMDVYFSNKYYEKVKSSIFSLAQTICSIKNTENNAASRQLQSSYFVKKKTEKEREK